jgi:hypothetical protein
MVESKNGTGGMGSKEQVMVYSRAGSSPTMCGRDLTSLWVARLMVRAAGSALKAVSLAIKSHEYRRNRPQMRKCTVFMEK